MINGSEKLGASFLSLGEICSVLANSPDEEAIKVLYNMGGVCLSNTSIVLTVLAEMSPISTACWSTVSTLGERLGSLYALLTVCVSQCLSPDSGEGVDRADFLAVVQDLEDGLAEVLRVFASSETEEIKQALEYMQSGYNLFMQQTFSLISTLRSPHNQAVMAMQIINVTKALIKFVMCLGEGSKVGAKQIVLKDTRLYIYI